MTTLELLSVLHERGISLWLEGDRLRFRAPQDALTEELRAEIAQQRAAIIALLRQSQTTDRQQTTTILPIPRDQPLRLSFAQERLWFLDQWQPANPAYNIPLVVQIQGQLDISALEASIAQVIARHETLRTTFATVDGQPVQIVHPSLPFALAYHDVSAQPDAEAAAQALITQESICPFDLAQGPLLRALLLQIGPDDYRLCLNMHHIVSDGWSLRILVREIEALYQAHRNGSAALLPPLPIQYADFAAWQRDQLQGPALEHLLNYWHQQLHGAPALLELPTDYPRPAVQRFQGAALSFALPPTLTAALKALCQRTDSSLFMVLLAGFQIMLARISQQSDIVVGAPIAQRTLPVLENLIGFFANTLVLRSNLSGNPDCLEVLRRVRNVCLGAYDHQDIPFERLIDLLQIKRSTSYNPLVQVVFNLQQALATEHPMPGLTLRLIESDTASAKFDLNLGLTELGDTLHGKLEYNTDLFAAATIERFVQYFQLILQGMVANPQQRISQLPLLSAAERQQLLETWNATTRPLPTSSLPALVAEQVAQRPDAIALVDGDLQLSYAVLQRRANQLANHLIALGVEPEHCVGLCLDRSPALVIAMLAVLSAGATYVPLDPSYPTERLAFLLADAQVRLVLSQQHLNPKLPATDARLVWLDTAAAAIAQASMALPPCPIWPDSLAYVMYTSGSTGQPKGIGIPHQAIVRLVQHTNYVQIGATDRIAHLSNVAFDAATFEIWGALLNGARIVVLAQEVLLDPQVLARQLLAQQISTIFLTAALFNQLVRAVPDALRTVREVLCGGEACDPASVRMLLAGSPPARVLNAYGPTESTTFATWYHIEQVAAHATTIPIGSPISNTQVYVLDAQGQLVPVGVEGELYLGGIGLARGYYQQPALTAARFVPNPFGPAGTRLYRTGDRVRWRAEGTIEFLGRIDQQVKLRGFRIEPGEIEAVLLQHPVVRSATVLLREDTPGDKRLVAYVVLHPTPSAADTPVAAPHADLHRFLQQRLPAYMLPSAVVRLDALPLTANGKIDRTAIPAPDHAMPADAELVAPRTPTEQLLAAIWSEVLGQSQLDIFTDFFDLGGHSLRVTQVISRVRSVFALDVSPQALFEAPTIAGLAARIDALRQQRQGVVLPPLVPVSRAQPLPLSFTQQRFWLLQNLDPQSTAYHMPVMLDLHGDLHLPALQQSLTELLARHEMLRTVFPLHHDQPVQHILPPQPFPLPFDDLSALPPAAQSAALDAVTATLQQPFDLAHGPLIRARLLRRSATWHTLLLNLHHIIADGWSLAILVDDLRRLYPAACQGTPPALPALPIQYADFAVWQRQWLDGDVLAQQLAYWRARLADAPPPLALPADLPGRADRAGPAAVHSFLLPTPLHQALQQQAQQHSSTLFMLLLSGWFVLLQRYTGQADLCIGTPIANRTQAALESVMGCFVNTLALRVRLAGNPRLREVLAQVREVTLGAYAHQELPFDRLVEELRPERVGNATPFFAMMVTLQNTPSSALELPGLRLEQPLLTSGEAKFDWTVNLTETATGIVGQIEYRCDRFSAALIAQLACHYAQVLTALVSEPEQRLATLPLLSAAEQQVLLETWNATTHPLPVTSLPALVAEQVAQRPDAIALVDGDSQLSYAALQRRANQLANYLLARGLEAEHCVGLCLDRSPALVIAMLAVLTAGGTYVPLDPSYPAERLAFLLADAQVRIVLSQQQFSPTLPATDALRIWLDTDAPAIAQASTALPPCPIWPTSLAYVMYTSGSTGQPKGIGIPHQAIVRLVQHTNYVQIGATDRIAHLSNVAFDAATFEIWGALLNGARIVVLAREVLLDPQALARQLLAQQISTIFLTTALFNQLVRAVPDALCAVREVLCGGEACDPASVRMLLAGSPPARVLNAYGPTESTTFATWYHIEQVAAEATTIPIGSPISNTQVYVLDAQGQLVPVGVKGELYLGGIGLARGYYQQPALTAARFVPNPFGPAGTRLYRTGDRVRWRAEGTLEFLGRIDQQVKLRGFRIEPGEIEAVLLQHPAVRSATVLLREDTPGDKRLVAYVVLHPTPSAADTPVAAPHADLHRFLQQRLPAYMLPSAVVLLDALPLTANGKIDRTAIPAPDHAMPADAELVAPRTPTEQLLAAIWSEVLGQSQLDIFTDFFDLGGHSLRATQVISRVRSVFALDVSPQALFEAPTIAGLAAQIDALRQQRQGVVLPPLVPVSREQPLPLSFAQQRFWFLHNLDPQSTAYHMPIVLDLHGDLDLPALQQSLSALLARHEALRTVFPLHHDQPVQQIVAPQPVPLPLDDLSTLSPADQSAALDQATAALQQPFDLAHGPLIRARLLRRSATWHTLCLNLHHIIADGWSFAILVHDLRTLYTAACQGTPPTLPDLPIQYADFAVWQRQWLNDAVLEQQLAYWRARLADAPATLILPADLPGRADRSGPAAVHSFLLPAPLHQALQQQAQAQASTLFMLLLSGWFLLLQRYTGQDDLCIGTPIANRTQAALESVMGCFVNTLALRVQLGGNPRLREVLAQVREVTLGAYAHQELPFERLVEELRPDRALSPAPFFAVMMTLQNTPDSTLELPGLRLEQPPLENGVAKFDWTISLAETTTGIAGQIEYRRDRFSPELIARLAEHYVQVITTLVSDPEQRLATLPLLSAAERKVLLETWNTSARPLPTSNLPALVAEQVAQRPDAIALVDGDMHLSYAALQRRANQLANYLITLGVEPEHCVGLCLDRSPALVIAMLAVLTAGGTYVPLDPSYPAERLAFLLADAGVRIVLSQQQFRHTLPPTEALRIWLDSDAAAIAQTSAALPDRPIWPATLAYVMYTSGSTGRPKGIGIPHQAIVRLVQHTNYIQIGDTDRIAHLSNVAFDAATFEIWGALLNGARIVVLAREVLLDPQALAQQLQAQPISSIFLTTALFNQLVREAPAALHSVRELLFGGEAADPVTVRTLLTGSPPARVLHVYGPTESTTFATWYPVTHVAAEATTIPIGTPLSNTQVYVLDAQGQLVPVGVEGELYLGGIGLARGYYQQPALTAARFVPNPFGPAGTRLYRTGDRVRWRSDGTLEFLGRIDQQVKLRGFRIEPGEIETLLLQHPAVRSATVLLREDTPGDKRLVAYVVLHRAHTAQPSDLRSFLQQQLPAYMLPSAVVLLDALPLTANGKIDRTALPAPDRAMPADAALVVPRTPTEQALAAIWSEVLGQERIDICTDFFDLGGHSLRATQVISRVRSVFALDVPLQAIFEAPTIAGLAAQIDALRPQQADMNLPPLVPVSRAQPLPLSFAQQRFWFVQHLDPQHTAYHMPILLDLHGDLHLPALQQSLTELLTRHEALRTVFPLHHDQPVQHILPPQHFPLPLDDLSALQPAEQAAALDQVTADLQQPFDLAHGPLIRARLLRRSATWHTLLLNLHHIIADGWSLAILVDDLRRLYPAACQGTPPALPALPIQYADFAVWQRQWLAGDVLAQQLAYWRARLADAPPAIPLPADLPGRADRAGPAAVHSFLLPAPLQQALQHQAQAHASTLFMLLLSGWFVLLQRYTGQADLCIGTPIANRTQAALETVIGCFVNTLVLRVRLGGNPRLREVLAQVREVTLGAYAHQDLPFERLVEELRPERVLSPAPFFAVMLVLQNTPNAALELPGLRLEQPLLTSGEAKFDWTISLTEGSTGIAGQIEYRSDRFSAGLIARLAQHYVQVLTALVYEPEQRLATLPLLSAAERQLLLEGWNATTRPLPATSLPALLTAQVAQRPDAIALVEGDTHLSYATLERRANQLARLLCRYGITTDTLVGLYAARVPDMVVAILAILKAGGAYLPLDPDYPTERLQFIIQDARPRLVLTVGLPALPTLAVPCLALETLETALLQESPDNLALLTPDEALAYVIYTSGSTGMPKGVMIERRSLLNYLHWANAAYRAANGTGAPVHSSLGFDLTVTSLFIPLLHGEPVLLLPTTGGAEQLAAVLHTYPHFSLIKLTPAHLMLLNQLLPTHALITSARTLVIGGEALPTEVLHYWRQHAPEVRLINEYGPTETVVGCVVYEVPAVAPDSGTVPIGRPIANTAIYVLDRHMQPVPIGVVGELYIGGAGMGRGYLGRPDLTAERFVPNPFASHSGVVQMHGDNAVAQQGGPSLRLYRSGDLARWREDGTLEYVGRSDQQIKLRGYRIELGEIEAMLHQHPAVHAATVVLREDTPGESRLVAYVVLHPAHSAADTLAIAPHSELRSFLQQQLPAYMVPNTFVMLDALPLTTNGKVDRAALPIPAVHSDTPQTSIMPRSTTEWQLARIWEELLNIPAVGIHDNFFDLGGHSLLVARLIARIRQQFGQQLELATMFQAPTIEQLARALHRQPSSEPWSPLVALQPTGSQPPFFCVHPIAGTVLCYTELLRQIGSDQPFYAFQAAGLDGKHTPLSSITAMAATYIAAMRSVQPQGPYLLGGWSFGGIVAMEMAQQLVAQGQTVALLALLDSRAYIPSGINVDTATLLIWFTTTLMSLYGAEVVITEDELRPLNEAEQLALVLHRGQAAGIMTADMGLEELRAALEVFRANVRALGNYQLRPYQGNIVLFRASDEPSGAAEEPTLGWADWVRGHIDLCSVPGNHHSMLRPPHVAAIANGLRARIASITQH